MSRPPKNSLFYQLIPPAFIDLLRVARQVLRYPFPGKLIASNRQFQNIHHGKLVYVIANGPSLNNIDWRILKNSHIIVMNNFHRAPWSDEVRPVAHCIGESPDSPAWVDPSPIINGTNSESYWLNIACHKHLFDVPPTKKLQFVFPGYPHYLAGKNPIRLDKITFGFQTTAILAIQVALYMGFKNIRLLGFDHDWLASPDYSKHFYSEQPDEEDKLGEYSYFQILGFVTNMWNGYYALARAAKAHHASIINLSRHSYLDVFDQQTF